MSAPVDANRAWYEILWGGAFVAFWIAALLVGPVIVAAGILLADWWRGR